MGTVEIIGSELIITSHVVTYGDASTAEMTHYIGEEIEAMWNAPQGKCELDDRSYTVRFRISTEFKPAIAPEEILGNINPINNYFRIEEFATGHISFVDGLGSNTGYFLVENLYRGSTTAAHEYGHTLGLAHPDDMDIHGLGAPGIMYPRGTLVDPSFQYDPAVPAGQKGGTMHPIYRKVRQQDIDLLHIPDLTFRMNKAMIGDFTSVFHYNHRETI